MRVRLQVRFQGETDIDRHARPAGSVENDPSRTWSVRRSSRDIDDFCAGGAERFLSLPRPPAEPNNALRCGPVRDLQSTSVRETRQQDVRPHMRVPFLGMAAAGLWPQSGREIPIEQGNPRFVVKYHRQCKRRRVRPKLAPDFRQTNPKMRRTLRASRVRPDNRRIARIS